MLSDISLQAQSGFTQISPFEPRRTGNVRARCFDVGRILLGFGAIGLVTWLASHGPLDATPPRLSNGAGKLEVVNAGTAVELNAVLSYAVSADHIQALSVPPKLVASLPGDLSALSPERRQELFIRAILPIVLAENARIAELRRYVEYLVRQAEGGLALEPEQRNWLASALQSYGLPASEDGRATVDDLRALLLRVDAVPVSLALAQAALETGWGTSRFARQGNALFGQRTWDTAAGMLPKGRPVQVAFRVRQFETLADGVRAYLHNLNTHPAYEGFRALRAAQDRSGEGNVKALVATLAAYSEQGFEYIARVQRIIRDNRLQRLDAAQLSRAL